VCPSPTNRTAIASVSAVLAGAVLGLATEEGVFRRDFTRRRNDMFRRARRESPAHSVASSSGVPARVLTKVLRACVPRTPRQRTATVSAFGVAGGDCPRGGIRGCRWHTSATETASSRPCSPRESAKGGGSTRVAYLFVRCLCCSADLLDCLLQLGPMGTAALDTIETHLIAVVRFRHAN
jgi:hypothetical protein